MTIQKEALDRARIKKDIGNMKVSGRWYPWLIEQPAIWINQQGRIFTVDSIDGRYALNILKFIWRLHRRDAADLLETPIGKALAANVRRDMHLYDREIEQAVYAEPDEGLAMQIEQDREEWWDHDDFLADLVIDGMDSYGTID